MAISDYVIKKNVGLNPTIIQVRQAPFSTIGKAPRIALSFLIVGFDLGVSDYEQEVVNILDKGR